MIVLIHLLKFNPIQSKTLTFGALFRFFGGAMGHGLGTNLDGKSLEIDFWFAMADVQMSQIHALAIFASATL